jgi:hypothetical protein
MSHQAQKMYWRAMRACPAQRLTVDGLAMQDLASRSGDRACLRSCIRQQFSVASQALLQNFDIDFAQHTAQSRFTRNGSARWLQSLPELVGMQRHPMGNGVRRLLSTRDRACDQDQQKHPAVASPATHSRVDHVLENVHQCAILSLVHRVQSSLLGLRKGIVPDGR